MREPIGVTLVVPAGQETIRVRGAESGEEVFVTDKPYLATDGKTLVAPIPVAVTEDETYRDSAGVLRETWVVSGLDQWTPTQLFASGQPGYWPGGYAPSSGRLYQDATGVTPAATYGQPVGLSRRQAGTADPSQATALSRPTLARWPKGGRRNLLTRTEDLTNGAWIKNAVGIGDAVSSPYGTIRKIIPTSANVWHSVYQSAALDIGSVGIVQCVAKAGEYSWLQVLSGSGWGVNTWCNFDLSNGVIGNKGSATPNATIIPLGEGFYLCTAYFNLAAGSAGALAQYGPIESNLNARAPSFAGNDVSGIYAGCFQLTIGLTASPYQRVTTQYDVTEAGVPDVWHLSNDGGDSLPVTLPAGTYGRAWVDVAGVVVVDSVTNPSNALVPSAVGSTQADVILRQGAFTPAEEAAIRAYWGRLYA